MQPEPRTGTPAGDAPPPRTSDALQAWKDADETASEAERCLYAAWHAYRASGRSVPALLQHRATMARMVARQRLHEAIAANKAAAPADVMAGPARRLDE
ncbi:hypothetical protein GCM10028796_25780 [Ramlibacter monticola]|uniref:Uncharacterized protein n=1 Tax=Ramlibacter monticola TaxID=1926872 RepID=A0A937CVE4_9BURK|nr:hypothetical protein [Ramlibacter monticola]MBL0393634.1 hypothetical protein [Ramlibacter monticola]